MDLLCKICDREIIEEEYNFYIASLRKKDDKSIYKNMLIIILIWMQLIEY